MSRSSAAESLQMMEWPQLKKSFLFTLHSENKLFKNRLKRNQDNEVSGKMLSIEVYGEGKREKTETAEWNWGRKRHKETLLKALVSFKSHLSAWFTASTAQYCSTMSFILLRLRVCYREIREQGVCMCTRTVYRRHNSSYSPPTCLGTI